MKKFCFVLFCSLLLALKGISQFADPAVSMTMAPGTSIQKDTYGLLTVNVCNLGSTQIVDTSLSLVLSASTDSEIYDTASTTGPKWKIKSKTTGTGNTFVFENLGIIAGNTCTVFKIKVRGTVISGFATLSVNVGYKPGTNAALPGCGPAGCLNSSQGNISTGNDNAGTSLAVVGTTNIPPAPGCLYKFNTDQAGIPPTPSTDFGDFEAGASNFNVLVSGNPLYDSTKYERFMTKTNLVAPNFQFVSSPDLVTTATKYLPFPALNFAGNTGKMMIAIPPAGTTKVWGYYDSAKINTAKHEQNWFDTATYVFSLSTTKVDFTADVQLQVNVFDDSLHTLMATKTITLSQASGYYPGVWKTDTLSYKFPANIAAVNGPFTRASSVNRYSIEINSLGAVPFGMDWLSISGKYGFICPTAGPLPIKILSFNASKLGTDVLVSWVTATESNSRNFEVQRSTDGINWETIGTVAAAGNSNIDRNYSFIDTKPVKGTNYYRLRLNDLDSRFTFSDTRVVIFGSASIDGIKILPNPTMDRVYITTTSSSNLQSVMVYSADGKLMQQNQNFVTGGNVDMSQLSAGTYIFKITDKEGNTKIAKVVKMNSK